MHFVVNSCTNETGTEITALYHLFFVPPIFRINFPSCEIGGGRKYGAGQMPGSSSIILDEGANIVA